MPEDSATPQPTSQKSGGSSLAPIVFEFTKGGIADLFKEIIERDERDGALILHDLDYSEHTKLDRCAPEARQDPPRWSLSKLSKKLAGVHIVPFGVAWHPGASTATDLLLRVIHNLGPVPQASTPSHQATEADQRKTIEEACRQFCKAVNPSCWVAYCWDRGLNRVRMIWHDGLKYPEAMWGVSWQKHRPRRVLLDDATAIVRDEVTGAQSGDDVPPRDRGSFRDREETRLVKSVLLRWRNNRLAIFLNWRRGEWTSGIDDRGLEQAARYFAGWLADSDVDWPDVERTKLSADAAIVGLGTVLTRKTGSREMDRKIESLIREIATKGKAGRVLVGVHWTDWNGVGSKVSEVHLRFADSESVRIFPTKPVRGAIVEKSIAAQAVVWKAPILIRDMKRVVYKASDSDPNPVTWQDLDVPPNEKRDTNWKTGSELMIPMKDAQDSVRAVIGCEAASEELITEETLERLEPIVDLLGRLLELKDALEDDTARAAQNGGPRDRRVWRQCALARRLLNQARAPQDEAELLNSYCAWVRRVVHADLVQLLIFDSRSQRWRPDGLAWSRCFVKDLLLRNHNIKLKKPNAEVVQALLPHTLRWHVIPSRYGRTWRVFTSRDSLVVWPIELAEPKFRPYLALRTAVAIPFTHQVSAQPDGVLWMRFKGDPTHLVSHETADAIRELRQGGELADHRRIERVQKPVTNEVNAEVTARIGRISEVVAAMYAIFRFGSSRRPRSTLKNQPEIVVPRHGRVPVS